MTYTNLEVVLITLGIFFAVFIFVAIGFFVFDLIYKFHRLCSNVEEIKILEEMREKRRED
jgi:hypothetical protein